MAKDMLNAVYNAEEECKQREIDANKSSQQKSETARQEAENLIAEAKSKAAADADRLCELAKAEGSKELDKAKSEADRQCAVLSQTADKNRNNVIKNAVNLLSKR